MVGEFPAPGPGLSNEHLHQRFFGLNGVLGIVGGPDIEDVTELDRFPTTR
jgi:hypothetical protein